MSYWHKQLSGIKKASFPSSRNIISAPTKKTATNVLNKIIEFPKSTNTSITKASILHAAWVIVLTRHSDSDDVCFGTTVSGRHASVPGLDATPGLVVATVPVRVRIDRKKSMASFLKDIQMQASEMVAYEQFGLQNISKIDPEIKNALDFTSLLAVQPIQTFGVTGSTEEAVLSATDSKLLRAEEIFQNYFSYPLVVQCHIYDDMVNLMFIYDSSTIAEHQLQAVSHQFDHVVQQLLKQSDYKLDTLSVAGAWDLQQALNWNIKSPEDIQSRLHDLISEHAKRSPDHEAVFSSEGNMTYAALDHLTNLLESHHADLGVGPETIVPFCFEKSIWTVMAIVGILEAGGVFVPLDPSHPAT